MSKMESTKRDKGLTLIEALITVAIHIIVAAGMLQIWQYTSERTLSIFDTSNEFENARVAMDALLMNIQLADEITLETDDDGTLRVLTLVELDPYKAKKAYVFKYNGDASLNAAIYHKLVFGDNSSNELASHIAELKITKSSSYLNIKIITDGEAALTFESSTSIRNKIFYNE
jgi:type II secretory pathway component PulJ